MTRWLTCGTLLLLAVRAYGQGEEAASISPSPTTDASSPNSTTPSYSPLPTLPTNNTFFVNYTNGSNCLLMNGSIAMAVKHNFANGTEYVAPVAVLNTTEWRGKCGANVSNITLEGLSTPLNSTLFTVDFVMAVVPGKSQWNITNVTIWMNLNNTAVFPGNKDISNYQTTLLANDPSPTILPDTLDFDRSYVCNTQQSYLMTVQGKAAGVYNLTLNLTHFQVQAFFDPANVKDTTQFQESWKCPADIKGSKIVPIAVGAALAGLVIIVVVAYIVGRLRSRKHNSYEALS